MPEILKTHGNLVVVAVFIAFAVLLHVVLRPKPGSKRPQWIREWLWKFLCPLRAPITVNVLVWIALSIATYIDKTEYQNVLLVLTSVAVCWLTIVFIKVTTNSFLGTWFIGLGVGILVLANLLPAGNLVMQALSIPVFKLKKGDIHTQVAIYEVLTTALLLITFFLLAGSIVKPVEEYLRRRRDIKASSRNLIVQILKIVLYTTVVLMGLRILGVDLTTLAVFSGALGVGLGFGLQKITSNFVSGIILLLEQSIEEGSLIELSDGTLGFIRKNSARYTLLETFDSREILVPNEEFIVSRVTNLTYSNTKGRIEIPIGISYKSDIELARNLIIEAAKSEPICISDPEPMCYLDEFGDSSVNFLLHFWVKDIKIGRFKPKDKVLTAVWHSFKKHGIEIPFPQRDVHLKNVPDESMKIESGTPE